MRVLNKRSLYPIFFLSAILILVLFYSGFSYGVEGLTTQSNTVTVPNEDAPITVPIQVSPATAAIVSNALDSVVQMGVSMVKNTNREVKKVEAEATMSAINPTTTTTVSPTPPPTNLQNSWVSTPITSTTQ